MSTIRKKYVSSMEDYGNLDRNYTKDLEKRIKEVCNKAFLYTLVFDYYDYKTFRYLVEIDIDTIDPSQEKTILESLKHVIILEKMDESDLDYSYATYLYN